MDPITSTLVYKLACLGAGLLFCILGYRLFVLGIFSGAGDMDARFHNNRLVLKKAAPGTFFALFGAAVIGLVVWKGLQLTQGPGGDAWSPVASTHCLNKYSTDIIRALKTGSTLPTEEVTEIEACLDQTLANALQSIPVSSTQGAPPIPYAPISPWEMTDHSTYPPFQGPPPESIPYDPIR